MEAVRGGVWIFSGIAQCFFPLGMKVSGLTLARYQLESLVHSALEGFFCFGMARNCDRCSHNATNIFSLATKYSGFVATLATSLLYDLDLNTNISSYLALLLSPKMCQIA